MNKTFEKVGFKVENIQREMIEEIVRKVIEQQLGQTSAPGRVVDKSGVISVKAADIKPEPFDTGKEGDKVFLTDIFSLEESPRIAPALWKWTRLYLTGLLNTTKWIILLMAHWKSSSMVER